MIKFKIEMESDFFCFLLPSACFLLSAFLPFQIAKFTDPLPFKALSSSFQVPFFFLSSSFLFGVGKSEVRAR
jgi:hypothetical protein